MTYGRLIEYEGQMAEMLRRELTYPAAARLAAQARPTVAPAVPLPRPRRFWLVRRLNRATA